MTRLKRLFPALSICAALAVACNGPLAETVTAHVIERQLETSTATFEPLSDVELATVQGGQLVDDALLVLSYLGSVAGAAAIASAEYGASGFGYWMGTVSGVGGMAITSYYSAQWVYDTYGNTLAYGIGTAIVNSQSLSTGDIYLGRHETDDIPYMTNSRFTSETIAYIDDFFCGGFGCMCDEEHGCDWQWECIGSYCQVPEPPQN